MVWLLVGIALTVNQEMHGPPLLAAVGIFVIGGLLAIYDGVQSLRHPEPLTDVPVGVAVLLVSVVLEGLSWRTAHRQLRAEAAARPPQRRPVDR